jgi:hypothetical protein
MKVEALSEICKSCASVLYNVSFVRYLTSGSFTIEGQHKTDPAEIISR